MYMCYCVVQTVGWMDECARGIGVFVGCWVLGDRAVLKIRVKRYSSGWSIEWLKKFVLSSVAKSTIKKSCH